MTSSVEPALSFAVDSVFREAPLGSVRCRTLSSRFLFFSQPRHPADEAQQAHETDQAGQQAAGDQEKHVVRCNLCTAGHWGRACADEAEAGKKEAPENDPYPCDAVH